MSCDHATVEEDKTISLAEKTIDFIHRSLAVCSDEATLKFIKITIESLEYEMQARSNGMLTDIERQLEISRLTIDLIAKVKSFSVSEEKIDELVRDLLELIALTAKPHGIECSKIPWIQLYPDIQTTTTDRTCGPIESGGE